MCTFIKEKLRSGRRKGLIEGIQDIGDDILAVVGRAALAHRKSFFVLLANVLFETIQA
jgi:hypothetical protein